MLRLNRLFKSLSKQKQCLPEVDDKTESFGYPTNMKRWQRIWMWLSCLRGEKSMLEYILFQEGAT